MEHSGESSRPLIRGEISRHMTPYAQIADLENILDEKLDFEHYIESVFCILFSEKNRKKSQMNPDTPEFAENENEPCTAPPDGPADTAIRPAPEPVGRKAFRHPAIIIVLNVVYALVAAVSGEFLWMAASAVMSGSFSPDGVSGEPSFISASAWGFSHVFPIGLTALLLLKKSNPFKSLTLHKKVLFVLCYGAAGAISGILLLKSGLPGMVGALAASPVLQGLLHTAVFSLVLSFFPLLTLLALLRFPQTSPGAFLLLEFLPAMLSAAVALPFLISQAVPYDKAWPGGFASGFVLKLLMAASILKLTEARSMLTGTVPNENTAA